MISPQELEGNGDVLCTQRNASLTLRVEKHLADARCGEEEKTKRQKILPTI